ncbi:hypothetical protein TNCT_196141 [Trichonephila clavata]|uniref:Uncharacterized protein n=1 Tax=Trichonephila clavata TaxID=2740835 RepID=A0A8X6JTC2_TRICU|nr:hypothetical protein TNCT_196141 [Trichonephila clavata]
MLVSPPSSFEESSGGYTWHVRKVWEFWVWRGPDGTGRNPAFAKNGDNKWEFSFGNGKPFDSSAKKRSPFHGLTVSNPRHCRPEVSIRITPTPRRSNKLQTHVFS